MLGVGALRCAHYLRRVWARDAADRWGKWLQRIQCLIGLLRETDEAWLDHEQALTGLMGLAFAGEQPADHGHLANAWNALVV